MASGSPWLGGLPQYPPPTRLSKMLDLTSPLPSLPPVLRIIFQTRAAPGTPIMLEWSHGYRPPPHQDGTVTWIFPYISVDGFYPAEGTEPTEHTGHECGRSQTSPPATSTVRRPFPGVSSALTCTQTLLGLPILLPALGRVAWLVQTPRLSSIFSLSSLFSSEAGRERAGRAWEQAGDAGDAAAHPEPAATTAPLIHCRGLRVRNK